MSKFRVGEIAILLPIEVSAITGLEIYVNQDVEVIVINPAVRGRCFHELHDYSVMASDGHKILCDEYELKKKKPPEEDAREWFDKNIDVTEKEKIYVEN